jgi:site-specific DNA-methyltransferase (adenine-specific)
MALNSGMMSSNKDDWETPKWLFDRLDGIFHFQLDAAASANNRKCQRYFDETNRWFGHLGCRAPCG